MSKLMKRWLMLVAVAIAGLSINFIYKAPKLGVSPRGYSIAFGSVYYDGELIPKARANLFYYSIMDEYGDYGWDKVNAFYKGKILPDAHPTGFSAYYYELKQPSGKFTTSGYYKNKNGVFYMGQRLEGADIKTFYATEFDKGRSGQLEYVGAQKVDSIDQ
tara:strand:+ start:30169 stop:30648 length:480 start_codon:yes stop_codon:yes gene_type:complete